MKLGRLILYIIVCITLLLPTLGQSQQKPFVVGGFLDDAIGKIVELLLGDPPTEQVPTTDDLDTEGDDEEWEDEDETDVAESSEDSLATGIVEDEDSGDETVSTENPDPTNAGDDVVSENVVTPEANDTAQTHDDHNYR